LAAKILDEYMQDFQKRNPTLRVFSAHLHMDEATPHLHIDFVPYITGSKRGVDTRVSMKQALAALGFRGGTRKETEWSQWVTAEKEQLALVMERHGIEWEHKGTHEEHLSVLEYKKQERAKEVIALEKQCSELEQQSTELTEQNEAMHAQLTSTDELLREAQVQLDHAEEEAADAEKKAKTAQKKLSAITSDMRQIEQYAAEYTHFPEDWLPEPNTFETAKSYHKRILPLITKVVKIIQPLYAKYLELKKSCDRLLKRNKELEGRIDRLHDTVAQYKLENEMLRGRSADLDRAKTVLGIQVVDNAIESAKQQEQMLAQQKAAKRKHSRDAR
jgi:chromosome segregation ATPase